MPGQCISALPPIDAESNAINAVIETPKGSRNKFRFDPEWETFTLRHVLPLGSVFPYDFGFIPGTLAEDGDPLDVLILMDSPAFPGCLVHVRLIGVIEAEQSEHRKTERNDRLLAVALQAHEMQHVKSIRELPPKLLEELEHFFVSYNEARGKKFTPLGKRGPRQATKLMKQAIRKAQRPGE